MVAKKERFPIAVVYYEGSYDGLLKYTVAEVTRAINNADWDEGARLLDLKTGEVKGIPEVPQPPMRVLGNVLGKAR